MIDLIEGGQDFLVVHKGLPSREDLEGLDAVFNLQDDCFGSDDYWVISRGMGLDAMVQHGVFGVLNGSLVFGDIPKDSQYPGKKQMGEVCKDREGALGSTTSPPIGGTPGSRGLAGSFNGQKPTQMGHSAAAGVMGYTTGACGSARAGGVFGSVDEGAQAASQGDHVVPGQNDCPNSSNQRHGLSQAEKERRRAAMHAALHGGVEGQECGDNPDDEGKGKTGGLLPDRSYAAEGGSGGGHITVTGNVIDGPVPLFVLRQSTYDKNGKWKSTEIIDIRPASGGEPPPRDQYDKGGATDPDLTKGKSDDDLERMKQDADQRAREAQQKSDDIRKQEDEAREREDNDERIRLQRERLKAEKEKRDAQLERDRIKAEQEKRQKEKQEKKEKEKKKGKYDCPEGANCSNGRQVTQGRPVSRMETAGQPSPEGTNGALPSRPDIHAIWGFAGQPSPEGGASGQGGVWADPCGHALVVRSLENQMKTRCFASQPGQEGNGTKDCGESAPPDLPEGVNNPAQNAHLPNGSIPPGGRNDGGDY